MCDKARTQTIVGHGHDPCGEATPFACLVARYRAKQAEGAPTFRYRKPVDRRSRVQQMARRRSQALQSEYQAWLDATPQNMADSGTAEALIAIYDLDVSEPRQGVWPRLNCCTM